MASSKDRKIWKNVKDEPVLSLGPHSYDKLMIALNQVIKYKGRYYAYYHGSGTPTKPRKWCCAIATSTDLVHWKKYTGNPITHPDENKSSGILLIDSPKDSTPLFRLYTMHNQVFHHRSPKK